MFKKNFNNNNFLVDLIADHAKAITNCILVNIEQHQNF